jgi:hypothetical protein
VPKGPSATPAGSGRGGRAPQRPPRSASRRKRERRRLAPAQTQRRSFWRRREGIFTGVGAGVVVAGLIVGILALRGVGASPHQAGTTPRATPSATPTAAPLAAVSSAVTGQAIDGIQCQAGEQLAYHIHAHLAIFVNGAARSVPYGIGIPPPTSVISSDAGPYVEGSKCYYWLHTHTGDGIIHVESPTQAAYTLGQFFDIWQQPLSAAAVGPATGTLFMYVNGQRYTGDPRAIQLSPHALIQLDVGSDVAPKSFTFPPGL